MSCMRLMNRDYSHNNYANRYVSSESPSFPYSNVDDIYRRHKFWRSAGYFSIVSGSNQITFRESVGVDIVATVPVAAYESVSDLSAAIKSALELVGASTYTVSRDSQNRFQITSDGTGGGGVFQLRMSASTIASTIGFAASDLTGALTYVADDIANHTEEFVVWDMGVPLNPTDFVIAGTRNDLLKISPTATIKLQGNSTNNWTAPEYDQDLTYDDRLIYQFSETGLHTEPLRFWRFFIQDIRNPYGYSEFSLSFLGISQDFARGCVRFPLRNQPLDRSVVTVSEGGNEQADKRPKLERLSLDWNGLTKEDREALHELYEEMGISEPFFLSADSNAVFSTKKENWVKYVRFDSDPTEELVSPNNFNMSMTVREQL